MHSCGAGVWHYPSSPRRVFLALKRVTSLQHLTHRMWNVSNAPCSTSLQRLPDTLRSDKRMLTRISPAARSVITSILRPVSGAETVSETLYHRLQGETICYLSRSPQACAPRFGPCGCPTSQPSSHYTIHFTPITSNAFWLPCPLATKAHSLHLVHWGGVV